MSMRDEKEQFWFLYDQIKESSPDLPHSEIVVVVERIMPSKDNDVSDVNDKNQDT